MSSIIASEIVWRKPTVISDASSNGGRMAFTAIANAVKNNIWPDVPQSERTAGSLKYRKVYIHIANDSDLALISPKVFVETQTPGDDRITFFPGTQTDTQANITGIERQYGAGKLNANISANATTITVLTELAADNIFRDGDLIRISDKSSVDDVSNNEEFLTITGTPTYAGDVCTIHTTTGTVYPYLAANTKVASVYQPGDISANIASFTKNSVGGTYNTTDYPVLPDAIASIRQSITLTFSNATTFSCVGDTLGSMGTGNVNSDFSPSNPNYTKPYFTLRSLGFGGVWQNGDTITFIVNPAAVPIWYKRTVPAGASSLSGDKFIIGITGESA